MYSDLPPLLKWVNRLTLAGAWAFGGFGGFYALSHPPTTILSVQPVWMSVMWGILVMVGSTIAAMGVITGKNRVEESAAWFSGAGTVAYVLTLWGLVLSGETTRATQASLMTALLMFILSRALTTGAHNYRLRKVATAAIPEV